MIGLDFAKEDALEWIIEYREKLNARRRLILP